jgi:hypothetical protein
MCEHDLSKAKIITVKLIAVLLSLFVASANAIPIVINGSLEGPINNGGVPSGWNLILQSPDTIDQTSNLGFLGNLTFQATPSPSPDGGTWVGMAATDTVVESFGQLVNGFSIGLNYDIAWYHANFGHAFGLHEANGIQVLIDGNVIGNGGLLSLGEGWFNEMLSFTATATSHQIEFRSLVTQLSYQSIDGIRISESNVNNASAPLVSSLFILSILFLMYSRQKH